MSDKPLAKIRLWWIADRDRYRVWRSDWSGDQFEFLTRADFEAAECVARIFSIPFHEWTED